MYNMDISIFGFKINLEILILIGVVYLILVSHTVCGCFNYSLIEGLENNKESDASGNAMPIQTGTSPAGAALAAGAIAAAGDMMASNAKNGASKPNGKAGQEGFVGANTNYGQSSPYDLSYSPQINTSSWDMPDMTVVPGKPLSKGVRQFLEREPQPVPLPEGEMLMFANTPFKPECCPNTYSTSTGCACMTGPQYNYLVLRGGNNVPYSQY